MKHFRILIPLLVLTLLLSGCGSTVKEPYDVTYDGKTITVYPETCTIVDGLDVYRYTTQTTDHQTYYDIVYPNGGRYYWTATKSGGQGGWSDGYDETRYIPGDILVDALQVKQPRQRIGNPGIGLLLMGLGAVNFFLPELPFYLRYGWAVENAEPSNAYIVWTKAGGAVAAIAGLVYCFI